MPKRDFYDVLGVPRGASQDELRKAYKKLARRHHPDSNQQDPEASKKFAEITEAWEVLGDEQKRQQYDQFGHAAAGGGHPFQGGNPFQGFGGGGGMQFDMEDLLGGMFGGGGGAGFGGQRRGGGRARKGDDVRAEITIPFAVAAEGGEHTLTLQNGSKSERIAVKVPAGIDQGQTIRLAGQGNPGPGGGAAGDLLVTVAIAPHPWFRREGFNLVVEAPITPAEAALGTRIEVPTLSEGTGLLTVPAGTSSGSRLRLRGKGVRNPKTGERGDQFVSLKIVVPKELSAAARAAYEQLQQAAPESPRQNLWH
ncbi:MAG: DnaJ C-terminal domain-containing protein [Planctomycetaceae bacterium]